MFRSLVGPVRATQRIERCSCLWAQVVRRSFPRPGVSRGARAQGWRVGDAGAVRGWWRAVTAIMAGGGGPPRSGVRKYAAEGSLRMKHAVRGLLRSGGRCARHCRPVPPSAGDGQVFRRPDGSRPGLRWCSGGGRAGHGHRVETGSSGPAGRGRTKAGGAGTGRVASLPAGRFRPSRGRWTTALVDVGPAVDRGRAPAGQPPGAGQARRRWAGTAAGLRPRENRHGKRRPPRAQGRLRGGPPFGRHLDLG